MRNTTHSSHQNTCLVGSIEAIVVAADFGLPRADSCSTVAFSSMRIASCATSLYCKCSLTNAQPRRATSFVPLPCSDIVRSVWRNISRRGRAQLKPKPKSSGGAGTRLSSTLTRNPRPHEVSVPTHAVAIGRPQAIASRSGSPQPSPCVARTKASAARYSAPSFLKITCRRRPESLPWHLKRHIPAPTPNCNLMNWPVAVVQMVAIRGRGIDVLIRAEQAVLR